MDSWELEQQRVEMRRRSAQLERERRRLLRIAIHNSFIQKAEQYGILDDYLDGHEEVLGDGDGNADVVQVGGLQALWHHLELDDDDDDDDDWEGESEEGSSSDEWTDCSSSSSGGGSTTGSDEGDFSDGSSCGSHEEADNIAEHSQVFEEETAECSPSEPPEKRIPDECTDCSCPTGDVSSCGAESEDGSRH